MMTIFGWHLTSFEVSKKISNRLWKSRNKHIAKPQCQVKHLWIGDTLGNLSGILPRRCSVFQAEPTFSRELDLPRLAWTYQRIFQKLDTPSKWCRGYTQASRNPIFSLKSRNLARDGVKMGEKSHRSSQLSHPFIALEQNFLLMRPPTPCQRGGEKT